MSNFRAGIEKIQDELGTFCCAREKNSQKMMSECQNPGASQKVLNGQLYQVDSESFDYNITLIPMISVFI